MSIVSTEVTAPLTPGGTLPSTHQHVVAQLPALSQLIQTCMTRLDLTDEALFSQLAQRLHQFQCQSIGAMQRLALLQAAAGGGQHPGWQGLMPMPMAAFHAYALEAETGPWSLAVPLRFDGAVEEGGKVRFSRAGLKLSDTALVLQARRFLALDPDERLPILAFSGPPGPTRLNRLAYYLTRLELFFGLGPAQYLGTSEGVFISAMLSALENASQSGKPSLLALSREGIKQVAGLLKHRGVRFKLPAGTRALIVERSDKLCPLDGLDHVMTAVQERLGLEPTHVVHVLDRPSLPGQLYTDGPLAKREKRRIRPGWHLPPWMRACALDPEDLNPLPPGKAGLMLYVNLANVERPVALLSDELARVHREGGLIDAGTP